MSETNNHNDNGKREQVLSDKTNGPNKKQNTGTKTAICDACKESKERSSEHFYKKQILALKKAGKGICKSCWDGGIKQKLQKEKLQKRSDNKPLKHEERLEKERQGCEEQKEKRRRKIEEQKQKAKERAQNREALKRKAVDARLKSMRENYDEQVAKDSMHYRYPDGFWEGENFTFTGCSRPERLVGVYDIIHVSTISGDEEVSRTVKGATLTLSQEGKNIRGLVNGKKLGFAFDGKFEFKGNLSDFGVFEFSVDDYDLEAWGGEPFDETPTGDIRLLAERTACRWVPCDSNDSLVPECFNIEKANAFIAQQEKLMDHSKSWVTSHLKLPAPAVALIHEYTKAWTPPRPFFFIEKGDLRVYVQWDSDFRDPCHSQYIARKRATADQR